MADPANAKNVVENFVNQVAQGKIPTAQVNP
jgi:hypothetical protein